MNQKPVVHMIGNAHIDPVWLWRVGEGREEVLSTYRSAIERMAETPGFIFSSGGAITYRWVQEDDPDLFQAIQQRVAEGSWSIVNGWMIQPDCNIPSGESFVRQGLYGQRTFEALFGKRAVTGYNVDSFGHAGSLPQILRGCGLANYVFFRPAPGTEKTLPGTLFWWESDDGSRVLTSRPPLHYPSHPGDLIERIDAAAAEAPPEVGHVMCFYGVGNHGGGPTKANIASILQAMARPDGPEVRFGNTDAFFDLVRASGADLPVLHDELQHHSRGCYTAVSKIKWYNRKCEHALLTAEKLAALAHRYCDLDYPQDVLGYAWENVLFSQFHDILAGTSLREACEDTFEDYTKSLRIAERVTDEALTALSSMIDTQSLQTVAPHTSTSPGHTPRTILVFNPHPWEHTTPVEIAITPTKRWHDDWRGKALPALVHLTDDQKSVPCQVTQIEHAGAHYFLHLVFIAQLPALGYRCYNLDIPQDVPTWQGLKEEPAHDLENATLHLQFDPDTGWLTSIFDKEHNVELLRQDGGVPLVIDDPSDTWSHDVVSFDNVIGRFQASGQIARIENGPVRQTMRVVSRWGCSTITTDYILYHDDRQVYLDMTVDWQEQLKMLKLAFPLNLDNPQSTSSIPYGHIQRKDDGGEEPCQDWVDVSGSIDNASYGLSLLNDSKYGYDVLNGELRMSLLRSPVFAFHRPRQIEPGVTYHYTDQGEQHVRLALLPHAGDWIQGDVARRALALNAPPLAREIESHQGTWPVSASFVRCPAPNVALTTIKKAEEGTGLILRGYETAGRKTTTRISFDRDETSRAVTWKPHEIKTLQLDPNGAGLIETNMLEQTRD
ncbi:MAG: alpha-mannosidase [Anaerolineae bacterium]|nr:alpha-mannosidase [Anaerolineae bacterium]